MIESPVLDAFVNKAVSKGKEEERMANTQKNILLVLGARFGGVPESIPPLVQKVQSDHDLQELLHLAATCADLQPFQARLSK